MISHLKNLFNNGYDNGGDVTAICENESITVHAWVLVECSEYYESVVPSSIIYLKQYNSNIVKLLFRILYSEDIRLDIPLNFKDGIKFFELVKMLILKVDITLFCENIMENLKKKVTNENFMDILYLMHDIKNPYIDNIRYHIVTNIKCNEETYHIITNHIKNNEVCRLYKLLLDTKDKSLPHYMFRHD